MDNVVDQFASKQAGAAVRSEGEVSFLEMLAVFLRFRRDFAVIVASITIAGAGIALLQPRQFEALAKFAPSTPETSRLGSVVAQFGLGASLTSSAQSPDFYVALLQSREMLEGVMLSPFEFVGLNGDTMTGSYADLYGIPGASPREVLMEAVEHLRKRLTVSSSAATGIVTVQVRAEWPALAELINRRLLDAAHKFNIERRQSQAAAEREFAHSRLTQAEADLAVAEREVERFLTTNRRYEGSPQLVFELSRLQRKLEVRQQVVATLTQAHEQARVEEVRNTPLITILDNPEGSVQPVPVRRVIALMAFVLGVLVAFVVVVVLEYLRRRRSSASADLSDLGALWSETLLDANPRNWLSRLR